MGAVTLAESAKLSQDKMVKGVIEVMLKESPILTKLPFETIVGNALLMNREDPDNMGSVHFRGVDDVLTQSTAKFNQATFSLTSLIGDADVPNLIQRSRSNVNDQMGVQVKIKSKLMAYEFENCFVYGDNTSSNEFSGLHKLVATAGASRNLSMSSGSDTTGGPLTIEALDQLIDSVEGGSPDILLMNKAIRRRLSQKLRALGSYQTERDDYGNYWVIWNGVPIGVTDFIVQTEAITTGQFSGKTGSNTSSVFAFRFGEGDGVTGIQNGGIETEVWERLEVKDAMRTRLKWYCGLALYSPLAVARISGVTNAAMA